jgi:transcription elongation factor SPT5
MLHQSFLSKSLKDVRYTYTRWACTTAAKNIINLLTPRDFEEPQWWPEHAFVVTAGLCLVFDLFHRTEGEPEAQEHYLCVQKAIHYLQQFFTSTVALHGVRLLMSLLQEYNKQQEGNWPPMAPVNVYNAGYADGLPTNLEGPISNEEAAQFNFDIDSMAFEDLMDSLPVQGGLDSSVFLDSICGLGTGSFS